MSKIEWTEQTWNPVTGCSKVSPGCKNCYAENVARRFWGNRKFNEVQCHPDRLDVPLKRKKPTMYFVNSMSDLFHEDVPFEFIDEVFSVIGGCDDQDKDHIFQILTKRPERMQRYMASRGYKAWNSRRMAPNAWPPRNIWLGVSVEDQKTADKRIPLLLKTPAVVHWISAEPLLEDINLVKYFEQYRDKNGVLVTENISGLDWVVTGGESGKKARPLYPDWIRSLRDQCTKADVSFFFKQWGEWVEAKSLSNDIRLPMNKWAYIKNDGFYELASPDPLIHETEHHVLIAKVGKNKAGRCLDGLVWDQYPNA